MIDNYCKRYNRCNNICRQNYPERDNYCKQNYPECKNKNNSNTTLIFGPQGPRGETGPRGHPGPRGATGPIGPKGDTGELNLDVITGNYISQISTPLGAPNKWALVVIDGESYYIPLYNANDIDTNVTGSANSWLLDQELNLGNKFVGNINSADLNPIYQSAIVDVTPSDSWAFTKPYPTNSNFINYVVGVSRTDATVSPTGFERVHLYPTVYKLLDPNNGLITDPLYLKGGVQIDMFQPSTNIGFEAAPGSTLKSTGTVSLTNGSTIVTGVGTNFQSGIGSPESIASELVVTIDYGSGNQAVRIANITSDTSLTLDEPWQLPTVSGAQIRSAAIPTLIQNNRPRWIFQTTDIKLKRQVTRMDLFGSDIHFLEDPSNIQRMLLTTVSGSAFITVEYFIGSTPVLYTGNDAIDTTIFEINGNPPSPVTGSTFLLKLNNAAPFEYWKLYVFDKNGLPENISFGVSINPNIGPIPANSLMLISTAPITKNLIFQMVKLTIPPPSSESLMYDTYAGTYPLGANIELSNTTNTVLKIDWIKAGNLNKQLLMYAMPHHLDLMVPPASPLYTFPIFLCELTAIARDTWILNYDGHNNFWDSDPWYPEEPIDASILSTLTAQVANDAALVINDVDTTNLTYEGGKKIAKYATLALLAHKLGLIPTRDNILTTMKTIMNSWFNGLNTNKLEYDIRYGGLTTADTKNNFAIQYGFGLYNDHHFHLGYWVYACAVIAKFDNAWLNITNAGANSATNLQCVLHYIRDYANPSSVDQYYTQFRHMDFYESHSHASGLDNIADNRNQESISEAINSYYAIALFGHAIKQNNTNNDLGNYLYNLGKALTNIELKGANTYWLYQNGTHAAPYGDQDKGAPLSCIIYNTKITYANFFQDRDYSRVGIQMIPLTPIIKLLYDSSPKWIDIPDVNTRFGKIINDQTFEESSVNAQSARQWRSLLLGVYTLINKSTSLSYATALNSPNDFDPGLFKSQLLYLIATSQNPI